MDERFYININTRRLVRWYQYADDIDEIENLLNSIGTYMIRHNMKRMISHLASECSDVEPCDDIDKKEGLLKDANENDKELWKTLSCIERHKVFELRHNNTYCKFLNILLDEINRLGLVEMDERSRSTTRDQNKLT